MTEEEVRANAFAMPIANPAYPRGPYRFVDREYLIITYRTDPEALRRMIPAPLQLAEPVVKFEFINMPDSTGFGHYCESGQVIPVTLDGVRGGFVLSMYLDDHPPIAAGRELWGFPKKLGKPELRVHADTLMGTLDYSDFRVATGTMGFKHQALDADKVRASMAEPNFLLKIIPHVDGTPRICELVRYGLVDIQVKGAWSGPGALDLRDHALAPVADLPVLEVLSTVHILADLTLPLGTVVHDYLAR
ncbi:acetoacetate decarboxylase [Sphaerotilus sp.]|uniref:acetoacetate decarboxylase n=1 Tax=Sphaerotilus sp. TaxID=2093942 RepID=UPI0034E29242